jgi:alpha-L-fucosidase
MYFSLMDWHSEDWRKCKTDADARRKFVDRVHGELRQLMSNYGKIAELWYDGAFPLDAEGWRSKEMNEMVFQLQPDIVINNRSWMAGDFSTPEQTITASKGDWESCMTLNGHWGYGAADSDWKPPATVISNLIHCGAGGGNYLLNIGPRADGSVPEPSVEILKTVGKWMRANGSSIQGIANSRIVIVDGALVAQKGNTIYLYVVSWPGTTLTIGGMDKKTFRATLFKTGQQIAVELKGTQLILSGLPRDPPDEPVTVLALDFDSPPTQNSMATRLFVDDSILIAEQMKKGWG